MEGKIKNKENCEDHRKGTKFKGEIEKAAKRKEGKLCLRFNFGINCRKKNMSSSKPFEGKRRRKLNDTREGMR